MRKPPVPLLLAVILAAIFLHTPAGFSESQPSAGPVLATVNDGAIYPADLAQEMGLLRAELRVRNRSMTDRQIDSLRSQIIENLIERELLYQRARQKNIRIRSQWVGTTWDELQDQFGSRSAMAAYLSTSGLNRTDLEERIRKGLIVRRLLRREALRSIRVSEAEMEAFYRNNSALFQGESQLRTRHILAAVRDWENADEKRAALERIQGIQQRLEAGAKFAVLALEASDCPSRSHGGDLGYLNLDQMVPDFASAAAELRPGEISEVVTTRFGYHLIQMIDRKPATIVSFRDAREKIERTLRRNKENQAATAYVARLKQQANIVRHGSNP